jgi:acyl-CoA hydrolase
MDDRAIALRGVVLDVASRGARPPAAASAGEEPASMDTSSLKGRPVRESRSEYTYVALANDANPLGNVLGGRVMHLVDICAWLAARRHARGPAVTAAIDQMSFMHPIPIGQLVILRSSVNRVFRTSMEVGVKVWVENPQTGEVHHTSSAYVTFVAIGEGCKPVAVAPVIAESEEEERRYREAGRRREQRLAIRNGFAPSTTTSEAELVP